MRTAGNSPAGGQQTHDVLVESLLDCLGLSRMDPADFVLALEPSSTMDLLLEKDSFSF